MSQPPTCYIRCRTDNTEAKRRNAGGRRHKAGQPEGFHPGLLAQEFAHLLNKAMSIFCKVYGHWPDQES